MEKKAPQEGIEKIRENAAENYLEAGRSLNTILISSVVLILVAAFGLDFPGQIISSAYILTILSVFSLIVHKMRQLNFFRKTVNENAEPYEEKERFIWNIPQFLFCSYILSSLVLTTLLIGVVLRLKCTTDFLKGISS